MFYSLPATEYVCQRCGVNAETRPDTCWVCFAPLCSSCWDEYGKCQSCATHVSAVREQREQREIKDYAGSMYG